MFDVRFSFWLDEVLGEKVTGRCLYKGNMKDFRSWAKKELEIQIFEVLSWKKIVTDKEEK